MKKHVVIIGGGFGGIHSLFRMKKLIRAGEINVTLVNKSNYHTFFPMLHEVATASIDPYHAVKPIVQFKRYLNFQFVQGNVTAVDLERRRVTLCDDCATCPTLPHCSIPKYTRTYKTKDLGVEIRKELTYDYLVLAPGSVPNTYGIEGVMEHAYTFGSMRDAIEIRNHIFECFEVVPLIEDHLTRGRLLTFVVVGAGPTGVELVCELHDLIHHTISRTHKGFDFNREVKIYLINAAERPLEGSADEVRDFAEQKLAGKRIIVRNATPVEKVVQGGLYAKGLGFIESETIIWTAGVRACDLLSQLPVEKDQWGRAVVGPELSLRGHSEVFIIGDSAHVLGTGEKDSLPPSAQAALQEGRYVALNIEADLRCKARKGFRFHFFGDIVSLGGYYAGANLFGKVKFKGRLSWLLWKMTYLRHLLVIQPFSRTMLDWLSDLAYDREAMRLKLS